MSPAPLWGCTLPTVLAASSSRRNRATAPLKGGQSKATGCCVQKQREPQDSKCGEEGNEPCNQWQGQPGLTGYVPSMHSIVSAKRFQHLGVTKSIGRPRYRDKNICTQRREHSIHWKLKFVCVSPTARQLEGAINKPLGHVAGIFKTLTPFQKRAENILLSGRLGWG